MCECLAYPGGNITEFLAWALYCKDYPFGHQLGCQWIESLIDCNVFLEVHGLPRELHAEIENMKQTYTLALVPGSLRAMLALG